MVLGKGLLFCRTNLYSCGSSFKDLGKKCFTLNILADKNYLNNILDILDIK